MDISRKQGFTLMELVIVVAIVALLAAIAYPSYQQHIISANRADAQRAILELQQNLEAYYVVHRTYENAVIGDSGANSVGPAQAPAAPADAAYTLDFVGTPTKTTYVLGATPVPGSANEDDGEIQINSAGQKMWDQNNDGSFGSDEFDWRKS